MRTALVIAARILRQRLRDRSAIVFAVLTPLGLALAFAAIIPDFNQNIHETFAVVDLDRGALSQPLTRDVLGGLVADGIVDVRQPTTEAAARDEITAGTADAGIVVPSGFSADVQAGRPATITILGGASPIAREIARAAVTRYADQVGAVQLTVATVTAAGGARPDATTVAAIAQAVQAGGPIAVADDTAGKRQASLATFYAAAMAIMFVFFATQYGALAVLGERHVGTLNRLLAAPIRPAAVILGGALAGLALGALAMTVLVLATTLVGHANWGPPPLVALLIGAAVIAATGISALVATLARTVEQAGGLNAIVALCMAAVGGVFIPLSQAPEILTRIALVTPHAWFLRAIDSLALPGASVGDILPSVFVLVAMGAVTGAIGLARARRSLVPA